VKGEGNTRRATAFKHSTSPSASSAQSVWKYPLSEMIEKHSVHWL
jgi:hypothetical protein